jgi:hypothetical protein
MAASAQRAFLSCLATLLASLTVLYFPSLGGYGWAGGVLTWNLHPTLLLLAILGFLPFGMLSYRLQDDAALLGSTLGSAPLSRSQERVRHGAVQGAGLACALGGYAAAYILHELRGHVHLPAPHKPWSKQLHIYGGLLALALLVWQAALGLQLMLRPKAAAGGSASASASGSGSGKNLHAMGGFRVWVALVVVSLLGLWMPLVEKAGDTRVAPLLFALLAGMHGVSVALVARALPAAAAVS